MDFESVEMTERAVLFAGTQKADLRNVLIAEADPDWFLLDDHRKLFAAMRSLAADGKPIDRTGILRSARTNQAAKFGDQVLEAEWLAKGFAEAGAMSLEALTESHLPVLRRAYQSRCFAEFFATGLERSTVTAPEDLGAWAAGKLEEIMATDRRVRSVLEPKALQNALEKAVDDEAEAIRAMGVWTYVPSLDALKFKLIPGEPVCIAGRPSEGKSTLAWLMALGVSTQCACAYFPLEDGIAGVVERRMLQVAGDSVGRMRANLAGPASYERLSEYWARANDRALYIIDAQFSMRTFDIISTLQNLKRADPTLSVAFIDQMYDIADYQERQKGENDTYAIGRCVKRIIEACKALQICPVMIAQVNSNVIGHPNIEQIADTKIFGKRARKVVLVSQEPVEEGQSRDSIRLNIAKWTNGPKVALDVSYDGARFNIDNFVDPVARQRLSV